MVAARFWQDQQPTPGRLNSTLRIVLASVVALILMLTLQMPFASVGLYFIFLIARDSPGLSLRSGVVSFLIVVIAIAVELSVVILSDNDPDGSRPERRRGQLHRRRYRGSQQPSGSGFDIRLDLLHHHRPVGSSTLPPDTWSRPPSGCRRPSPSLWVAPSSSSISSAFAIQSRCWKSSVASAIKHSKRCSPYTLRVRLQTRSWMPQRASPVWPWPDRPR